MSGTSNNFNVTVRAATDSNTLIANNILVSAGTSGLLDAGSGSLGFVLDGNDYGPTGSRAIVWNGTPYLTVALWNAAVPGADPHQKIVDPSWSGAPPAGNCAVIGGPPQPCPSGYMLNPGSPMIGTGTNLISGYGLTLPTKDYYQNVIPNGVGTGYNVGADGWHH